MSDQDQASNRVSVLRQIIQTSGRTLQFIRNTILNILAFGLFFVFLIILFLFIGDDPEPVPDESILVFNPSGSIVEQVTQSSTLDSLLDASALPTQTAIDDILNTLKFASTDDRIKLLLLDFSKITGIDFSQSERIQNSIEAFKQTEKPVWAFASGYTQSQYTLASKADRVFMDPMGLFILTGVSYSTQYYKDLVDRYDIDVNVFAEGDYKSAIEPYVRSGKSEHVREAQTKMANALWKAIVENISSNRSIQPELIESYASELHKLNPSGNSSLAEVAVETGFIDELLTTNQMTKRLKEEAGTEPKKVTFRNYLPHVQKRNNSSENRIALIVIEGEILGISTLLTGQSSSWVKNIERVTEDSDYRALVLRVNSPGGSVDESEAMRRALSEFKETDRPLVVSFGGVAASGGYWIATPADHIVAHPLTITGSIGVFALFPTFENALANIGINQDSVTTSPYAGMQSLTRNPSDAALKLRKRQVGQIYSFFTRLVADSRDKPIDKVEDIAGGRVWLGRDALDLGLIDTLGDIEQAVRISADLADVDAYRVEHITSDSSNFLPLESVQAYMKEQLIGSVLPDAEIRKLISRYAINNLDPSAIFARCLECSVAH